MKNKKLTYFLGLIVLIVWGMIIYRIFDASGNSNDDINIVSATPVKEAFNDYNIPKDTTRLLLNYRDPFGLVKQKDTINITTRKAVNKKTFIAEKPIDWGFIKYSGFILNSSSKKAIAMVTINGQYVTLYEGQTRDQVKLIKNLRDSIKVEYDGKIKFIKIKSL